MNSGVNDITIVDMDAYEYWNLPRSSMVNETSLRRPKALELAKAAAEKSCFSINVTGINANICDLGWGFFEQFDLVLSPVDSAAVRHYIDRGCKLYHIPHITCGTGTIGDQFTGNVVSFPADSVVDLEYVWGNGYRQTLEERRSCSDIPDETQAQVMGFSAQIAGMTMDLALNYLLFMKLPNIWLIELAAIEIITVIVAVRKYAWSCCNKKGNVLALIGLYIFFWGALLVVFYRTGMSFDQYSYGKDWRVYQNNIKQIITGASAFGCSSELISNSTVTAFLADRNNYFLAGLYYGGWVVGVAIVIVLLLFLIASYRLLGKNVVFNRNYLVYKAAWWTLAMRVIWGIPYSIGVLPLPIALPFAGRIGFYMDTIALGLLIWSVIESKCIDESFYADKRVSDIFEGAEIKLMDWDEDNVFKIVLTCAEEATVICFAEEYKEHNVMVLRPIDLDETCVLIVEKSADTDLWHDVEDDTVRSEILQKYMENNRPDCMEVVE